ncbi:MAG: minor capsid protein [Clostridia bacterium]|nr:minor capsid protein [Clostridia bacterium]
MWRNQAALVTTVRQTLTTGILTGTGLNKAIDDLSKRFGVSYSSAARLIQTEHAKVTSDAQKQLYSDLGVESVELVCTLDSVTCPVCGALDGKVIKKSEMNTGVTVPPFHPRCRCTTAPYYEDMVGVGERAARDDLGPTYRVPEDVTYPRWKEGLTGETKNGIIKERYRKGVPVNPSEKTFEQALNPIAYAKAIVKKFRIHLRGSGQEIDIALDYDMPKAGKTLQNEPTTIYLGRTAFASEEELANTIAHELNHCRSYLKGGDAPESAGYNAGDTLAEYIRGER